ncbi:MAG: acyltransferase, partial [Candidatus Omnitrophica bacterium]|nr:acyltransferase [Candidatus Omnitrophota bacterium]
MLAQETMTRLGSDRQGSDLPLKQSWKDELSRSISRTHRIPGGHIASLDVARLIASFFIVLGHAGPFDKTVDYHGNIFLKLLLLVFFHVRRMGLPFFLLASGFLFGRSLEKGLPLTPRYVKALKRLTRIFLIWTVFYAFEPFGNPQLRENFLTFDMLKAYYWQIHYLAEQPLLLIIGGTKYNLW